MARNSRNVTREQDGREPKRFEQQDERPYPSNRQEYRDRGMARVSAERTGNRSSDRENDLYERQSI